MPDPSVGQSGDSTYDAVVAEVAEDLRLDEAELRSWFGRYLMRPCRVAGVPAEWEAACYAVYRLTKAASAFRMTSKSREQWRDRAIELGSPPHLMSAGASGEHTLRGHGDG